MSQIGTMTKILHIVHIVWSSLKTLSIKTYSIYPP